MTTENSVRVPREPTAEMVELALSCVYGDPFWRADARPIGEFLSGGTADESERHNIASYGPDRVRAAYAAMLAAAPAPAGADKCAFVGAMRGDGKCPKCSEHHEQAELPTPQPEQGAGLAEVIGRLREIEMDARKCTNAKSIGGLDDLASVKRMFGRLADKLAEQQDALAALARQQSRVVDEAMIERACSAYNDAAVAEGFTSASESAFDLMKGWMELALRAALEGGRDGR